MILRIKNTFLSATMRIRIIQLFTLLVLCTSLNVTAYPFSLKSFGTRPIAGKAARVATPAFCYCEQAPHKQILAEELPAQFMYLRRILPSQSINFCTTCQTLCIKDKCGYIDHKSALEDAHENSITMKKINVEEKFGRPCTSIVSARTSLLEYESGEVLAFHYCPVCTTFNLGYTTDPTTGRITSYGECGYVIEKLNWIEKIEKACCCRRFKALIPQQSLAVAAAQAAESKKTS